MVGTPRSDRGSDQSTGTTMTYVEDYSTYPPRYYARLITDIELTKEQYLRRSRREESQSKDQGTAGKGPKE